MSQRPLVVGLSLATTWLSGSAWRHPDSQVERHMDVDWYVELAQRAERACVDFVFRPDAVFLQPDAQAQGPGTSGLEPTLLLSCVARATRHVGLVTTISTSFQEPFHIARVLESLQIISRGRAAWNLVTGLEGQGNFGHRPFLAPDARYQQAEESLQVVQALLRSYPQSAVLSDRNTGVYADPRSILPIHHRGAHFQVEGPLTLPAGRFGRVPIFQAGASEAGQWFAAQHADAVFAATPTQDVATSLRRGLQQLGSRAGWTNGGPRVLPGLSLYLARSREEAQSLFDQAHAHLDRAQRLSKLASILGIDVSGLPVDRPLGPAHFPEPAQPVRSRTHADLLRRRIASDRPMLDDLLRMPEVVSSAHWQIVGSPADAVDEILAWQMAGALDGVMVLPGGGLQSLSLFLDEVVPALQAAGQMRSCYAEAGFQAQLAGV